MNHNSSHSWSNHGLLVPPEIPRHDSDYSSVGYDDAIDNLMRRRAVQGVDLTYGNLIIDLPVPSEVLKVARPEPEEAFEMSSIRYTAATCDPDEFSLSNYTLRQAIGGRHTEIFVVLTMYNEDEELFLKSVNAVIENIKNLCAQTKSSMWGPDGWKKVVVCIVSDGRKKINERTLQVLTLMGCYQKGAAKDTVGDKPVTADIFEYTSRIVVSKNGEVGRGPCPIQFLFCLKEQNAKKLNSHRWFFNAFGPIIRPNICVLIDVGTKPTGKSLDELWKCFDRHPGIGGACGEIRVDTGGRKCLLLTSPLAASQNFEYKMSNILDKPLESVFGYISVLPGAFSAYRYAALQNGPDGQGPLASYFKGEKRHELVKQAIEKQEVDHSKPRPTGWKKWAAKGPSLFERNMYLAEDRILCFEIVTKKHEAWTLRYVKSAKASTDVPTTVPEFISQRRRWLNGSLFAALHATVYMYRIWTSGHNILRKFILQLEFLYNAVQLCFTYTSLANFYLAFFFLVQAATSDPQTGAFNFLGKNGGKDVFEIILNVYIALLFVVVVCSLGNRPQGSKWTYVFTMFLFGITNMIALWCAAWTVWLASPHTAAGWKNLGHEIRTNSTFRDIVVSLVATYGLYLVSSILYLDPWHMITSFLQYMFLLPSYVNILMMYAMCNLHDVTWGTKGENVATRDLGSAQHVGNNPNRVEVQVPTELEDVNSVWRASQRSLRTPAPEQKQHRDAETKQQDHDKNSRTNFVLTWVATNMLMILVFTSAAFTNWARKRVPEDNFANVNPYLVFLLWSFAALSLIRFLGCTTYLLINAFEFVFSRGSTRVRSRRGMAQAR
ncbi:glycosyltransferase family 2 protein [Sistotremastrum suecicum HHB10207 ss-3]|uniref:Chitin synthase n=1 Tax=Sistotremastrum suecicum HHB10207 ss-3 TaxID=1314776 RepID=A0A165XFF3_9AGAM|nr:glycosyltransferase family 2 protein [Sistotremastrum suecicum HHB10207 ss-3]